MRRNIEDYLSHSLAHGDGQYQIQGGVLLLPRFSAYFCTMADMYPLKIAVTGASGYLHSPRTRLHTEWRLVPIMGGGLGTRLGRPDQREFPGQIATVGNYAMRGNSVKRPSYNLFLVICIRVIIIT